MKAEVTYRMSGPTELRVDGVVIARCSPENDERYQAFVDAARGLNALPDEFAAYRETSNKALRRVNAIRNSIVGFQTVNWSAHVYPLVAALNEAGYPALSYEEGKALATLLLDGCGGTQDYEAFLNAFDKAAQAKLDVPVPGVVE